MGKEKYTNHIDEYINFQTKYEKKFGRKCVVLMETGSFLEVYGVDNDTEKIGDVKGIAELLGIQSTRKNKKILENSRSNPLMAGFPTHSMNRFVNRLLGNGYTIVLVEQHNTGGKKFERSVSRIMSTGTYIDETFNSSANNVASVYVESSGIDKYIVGVAIIDLSTAKSHVYEIYSDFVGLGGGIGSGIGSGIGGVGNGVKKIFEEAYRFVESFNPSEIIIKTRDVMNMSEQDIIDMFNINGRVSHISFNLVGQEVKLAYQNELLGKVYKDCGMLTPIEYIGLESKLCALVAFVNLLQFAYEHDEKIVEKIEKPKFWKDKKHLILTNNTLYQLNIVRDGSFGNSGSLFDVINKTKTAMGKRLLNFRILNPIIDSNELRKRWNRIEEIGKLEKGEIADIEEQLVTICDIERFHRKISIGRIQPCELANLVCSYDAVMEIFKLVDEFGWKYGDESEYEGGKLVGDFTGFLKMYYGLFNIEIMSKYQQNDIEESFLKVGYDKKIDELNQKILKDVNEMKQECKNLTELSGGEYIVRLERNERDGYFYVVLNSKVSKLKDLIEKINDTDAGKAWMKRCTFKKRTTALTGVISDRCGELSDSVLKMKRKMKVMMRNVFLEILEKIDVKYGDVLKRIGVFIGKLDVDINNCIVSKKYGYCKPEIVEDKGGEDGKDSEEDGSYIDAEAVRHPIIERLDSGLEYVPNDVKIGCKDGVDGMMLYGLNGCGKSSYLKAVGLNIVMAQMGMYVSAKNFKFKPFTHLFTRILGNDNLFKGMSSFTVEMTELRSILCNSDNRSLVLGDEVCKGTETVSAVSIVSASVERFVKKNVRFLFTTHYHQLVDLTGFKKVVNDGQVKCYHFGIKKSEDGVIIYDRKLAEGNGETVYGIDVAKYIIDDLDFIKSAESVRKEIMGLNKDLIGGKLGDSKYNGEIVMSECQVCGWTGKGGGDGSGEGQLDVHHIKHQAHCDENGLVEHVSKNDKSNLVVLCKKHHVDVHSGRLEVTGWEDRIDGRVLLWKKINGSVESDDGKVERDDSNSVASSGVASNSVMDDVVIKKKKIDKGVSGRKKLSHENILWLKRLVNEEKISRKIVLKKLKDKKDIKISLGTLGKVINGTY